MTSVHVLIYIYTCRYVPIRKNYEQECHLCRVLEGGGGLQNEKN